jgi:hypothetical protein
MNRLTPIVLAVAALILAGVELLWASHGAEPVMPGRYLLICGAGFAALVFLAKVILPFLISKPEDRDDW